MWLCLFKCNCKEIQSFDFVFWFYNPVTRYPLPVHTVSARTFILGFTDICVSSNIQMCPTLKDTQKTSFSKVFTVFDAHGRPIVSDVSAHVKWITMALQQTDKSLKTLMSGESEIYSKLAVWHLFQDILYQEIKPSCVRTGMW